MHGFGMGFGWIFLLLLIIFVFYLINGKKQYDEDDSALDILRKRYANGEIDEEEYKTKLEELKK
ncbi:MAG: SHOCT domain-containing protein [Thiovulaceae bacterium]|nr:SHOCT domain-containing protein [Sulfurimonadaceae bacterium]